MLLKTTAIFKPLDLYKNLKKGPEPMEALAAYGKPTASLRQTYGRIWLQVLVPGVWQGSAMRGHVQPTRYSRM